MTQRFLWNSTAFRRPCSVVGKAIRSHPEFKRLVHAVGQMVGQPSPTPRAPVRRREEGSKPKRLWQTTAGRLGLGAAAVIIVAGLIIAQKTLQNSWHTATPA